MKRETSFCRRLLACCDKEGAYMCLSAAYEVKNGIDTLIVDRVTNVRVEGESVVLTDLLGFDKVVNGTLSSIDLNRNIIRIETK
jgi:predicted RNA-binding protein